MILPGDHRLLFECFLSLDGRVKSKSDFIMI